MSACILWNSLVLKSTKMHYSKSHRLFRFPSSSKTFMSLLIISKQKKKESQRFQKGCCLGFFLYVERLFVKQSFFLCVLYKIIFTQYANRCFRGLSSLDVLLPAFYVPLFDLSVLLFDYMCFISLPVLANFMFACIQKNVYV